MIPIWGPVGGHTAYQPRHLAGAGDRHVSSNFLPYNKNGQPGGWPWCADARDSDLESEPQRELDLPRRNGRIGVAGDGAVVGVGYV